MTEYQPLDLKQARQLIDSGAAVVDIRDQDSFSNGHISGAIHLDNHSLQPFIDAADLDAPLIVYCFHGMSSISAAQFLIERGFDQVYSLAGGFEAWKLSYPELCVSQPVQEL